MKEQTLFYAVVLYLITMLILTIMSIYCFENTCGIELENGETWIIGSHHPDYELYQSILPNAVSSLILVGIYYLIYGTVRYSKGIINRNIKKD